MCKLKKITKPLQIRLQPYDVHALVLHKQHGQQMQVSTIGTMINIITIPVYKKTKFKTKDPESFVSYKYTRLKSAENVALKI